MVSGLRAVVHDVSRGGICLHTSDSLTPGEKLELLLTDTDVFHSAEIRAEVRWSARGQVGLQWVDLDRRQREWLESRIRDWDATAESRKGMAKRVDSINWSW